MAALISSLLGTRNEDLAQVLSEITTWKWPRSDLNAWIKVLNKFDSILEEIVAGYTVNDLQLDSFSPASKRLLSEVLRFERLLLENSTNRKLFSSYDVSDPLIRCHFGDWMPFVAIEPAIVYGGSRYPYSRPQLAAATCATVLQSTLRDTGVEHLHTSATVTMQAVAPATRLWRQSRRSGQPKRKCCD